MPRRSALTNLKHSRTLKDHMYRISLQDFYNLVDVYLDAVFHPNCVRDEKTFAQEGWHYELEKPEVQGSASE